MRALGPRDFVAGALADSAASADPTSAAAETAALPAMNSRRLCVILSSSTVVLHHSAAGNQKPLHSDMKDREVRASAQHRRATTASTVERGGAQRPKSASARRKLRPAYAVPTRQLKGVDAAFKGNVLIAQDGMHLTLPVDDK